MLSLALSRRLKKLGFNSYASYLRSAHWRSLRYRYRNSPSTPNECYICGNDKNLELHHRTYVRLGHERFSDLVLLCRPCHQDTHDEHMQRRELLGRPNQPIYRTHERLKKQREASNRKRKR